MSDQNKRKTPQARYDELKRILEERRREILCEVQERIRDTRVADTHAPAKEVLDMGESSNRDIQEDIEFALIQLKAETLGKIDKALLRLEQDTYGYCFECGTEISERRLRALPFALCCKDCEEAREFANERARLLAARKAWDPWAD